MTLVDRLLRRAGLQRSSQQLVRHLEIDRDGSCRIDFNNGHRWSGRQDHALLSKMMRAPNPFLLAPPTATTAYRLVFEAWFTTLDDALAARRKLDAIPIGKVAVTTSVNEEPAAEPL